MVIKKWQAFEQLVAKVQQTLTPNATLKLDQKIFGRISKRRRQVDILIQEKLGNYDIKIVIECKDFKKPLSVKQIEAIIGLMKDVGANIGVVVAANGFTKSALAVGMHAQLKLYRLIDTGDHGWKVDIGIPSLCYIKNLSRFNFNIDYLEVEEPIPLDHSMMLYNNQQQEIGSTQDILVNWWLNHETNEISIGYHENVEFISSDVFFLIRDTLFPIKITANLQIQEVIYFANWSLAEISGFQDQDSKKILTHGFSLTNLNLEKIKNNWLKVEDVNDLSVKPVIILHLTTCASL